MEALINLRECTEYLTIMNSTEHQVKLAGTVEDPYFCGKDVCEVLGYRDCKEALWKFVESEDKIQLKKLVCAMRK
jgi:prophage antirepressor-like protein